MFEKKYETETGKRAYYIDWGYCMGVEEIVVVFIGVKTL